MKKNLIAIAVTAALVAAPSIALAGATIYGKAQLELVNTSGDARVEGLTLDDGSENGNVGSGNASSLGVKGSHDLGNGLTGLYNVNFNFSVEQNSGLGGRNAHIGLKGSFGTVLAGRIASPYKTSTVKWDPLLATFMQSRGSSGASGLLNSYLNNVIAYVNKFGNATFIGAVAFDESNDEDATEFDGDHAISASLNMPISNNLDLSLAMLDAGGDDQLATKVAVKWTSGKMGAVLQIESLDDNIGDADHVYANFTMKTANNGMVVLAVGSKSGNNAVNDGTYTAIAYKKKLSKKVSAHVGFVNHDEGALGNDDASQIGAGLRVAF